MTCKYCNEEVYESGELTDGMCLNCYHNNLRESSLTEIEMQHDYEEGLL